MNTTRLNKFIAHSAGLSRREADEAIEQGKVMINNAIARLGSQVQPTDIVTLNGAKLVAPSTYTYLLLNKPIGYVCSRRQQANTPTIYSLLPSQYHALKTVGRLDRDSSGLIILTDDGDFAHRMTHPRFAKTKIYQVELDHALAPLHQQIISDHGVQLDDGVSQFIVSKIEPKELNNEKIHVPLTYEVRMQEGRNRQIRRTFAALGYTVTRLHRITFGPYSLADEKSGEFHFVSTM